MKTLEQLVLDLTSYCKMKKELRVSYYTAKNLVYEHFNGDQELISNYEHACKINNRRKRKTATPSILDQVMHKIGSVSSDQAEYIIWAISQLSKPIKPGILTKFFRSQFDHYCVDDDLYSNFSKWQAEDTTWSAMDINHWVYRYGKERGAELFANRRKECSLLHSDPDRFWEIAEKMKVNSAAKFAEMSDYDRKKISPVCIEYYTSRGYSVEDGELLRLEQIKLRQNNENFGFRDGFILPEDKRNTNLNFYLQKGMTDEEAVAALSERQNNFTLEKCIARHGEEEGTRIYRSRQDKWQATLNAKSDEEKAEINKKKAITLANMIAKYGEKDGVARYEKFLERDNDVYSGASKTSRLFFDRLISEILSDEVLSMDDIFIGYEELDKREYFIRDTVLNKLFFYDFCIPKLNIIVEFHGLCYHYDHSLGGIPNNVRHLDESEIREKDSYKEKLATNRGFDYFVVWENSNYDEHRTRIMARIRNGYRKLEVSATNT